MAIDFSSKSKTSTQVPQTSIRPWFLTLGVLALLLALPLLVIATSLFGPYSDTWAHLLQTVLADYVIHSFLLMLGVAIGTLILGTGTAWLTAMCDFPGRKIFAWALLLPMAIPAYILAYTYTGLLDYSGPVQTFLRELFNWQFGDYWFPQIRSLGGAIAMLSLVLYPYMYLLVRGAFIEQSRASLEVSRSLGLRPTHIFFKLALPAARPAMAAGMTLALMETLADYGTVHYFGVNTFTTGIFRTWFSMGEPNTAAQLATILLVFSGTLLVLESLSRKHMRYAQTLTPKKHLKRLTLNKKQKIAAFSFCLLPVFFGFLMPALQLCIWLNATWQTTINTDFFVLVGNSFSLALQAAIVCLITAMLISFSHRMSAHKPIASGFLRMAKLGYAIPGTITAVGVLIFFGGIDNQIDTWLRAHVNFSSGLIFSGTLFAVIFAYAVRFVPLALQSLESGYTRVSPNIDAAARSLGRKPNQILRLIHLPLMRTSMLTALIFVFVDVLKELPTTLILRPFNFNTLAVRAHELASDERLSQAAAPALAIVAVGMIPVIILTKMMRTNEE